MLAEDAVERIVVSYEPLPPVVGVEAARAAEHLVHEDVPGNVAAHMVQEHGDVEAALAAAPRTLELDLSIERSASTPLEGRGVLARWDTEARRMRIWTSTQTSTGVRAAVAAKLDLAADGGRRHHPRRGRRIRREDRASLAGGSARALGGAAAAADRSSSPRTAASTSWPAPTSAQQLHHVRVGFDDEGHLLGLDVRFWHDHGAYIPYGLIVPIITSTQLLGPYKPGAYRVEFDSLYTNTVIVTPYRGAGRPQGAFVMERVMDAIARDLGLDRTVVRERELHPAGGFPLRPRADLPGRPAADLRLGRLPDVACRS